MKTNPKHRKLRRHPILSNYFVEWDGEGEAHIGGEGGGQVVFVTKTRPLLPLGNVYIKIHLNTITPLKL